MISGLRWADGQITTNWAAAAPFFPRVQTVSSFRGQCIIRNSARFSFWAPVASLLAFGQPEASRILSGRVPRAYKRLVGGSMRDYTGSWRFGRARPHTNGGFQYQGFRRSGIVLH